MKLQLQMKFCTDGDFWFNNEEELFDLRKTLYHGAKISYNKKFDPDNQEINLTLIADGDSRACQWAVRDLLESLICNIRTIKYYLVQDLYNFLVPAREGLFREGEEINYTNTIGGNYEGTFISLDKIEA